MSVSVQLPELGESVVEGTIAKWLVREGERVERDQPLVEVTTDKVDAAIPSPEAGVVTAILVAEGDTIDVGTEIARIDPAASAAAGPATTASSTPAPSAPAAAPAPAPAASPEPVRATPIASKVAQERGVELSVVPGSGPSGRVMRADVEAASAAPAPAQAPAAPTPPPAAAPAPARAAAPAGRSSAPERPDRDEALRAKFGQYHLQEGDEVVPMSPLRKIVAEHMVYSKHTSPHVGTVAEVDMGAVVAQRNAAKRGFEEQHGFKLTYLPFIVHAVVRALREFPVLNSSVIDESIVMKRDLNIGIAVETDKGLVVPVVRQADRYSLAGLAAAVEDLASRARNKKISADDLKGGTFTVSNPGRRGNLYGFAIINQPQVGILRLGEMVKRPVVKEMDGGDAIVVRPMMHLALSYDHRAVDGAPANAFLFRIRELLEEADFDL